MDSVRKKTSLTGFSVALEQKFHPLITFTKAVEMVTELPANP